MPYFLFFLADPPVQNSQNNDPVIQVEQNPSNAPFPIPAGQFNLTEAVAIEVQKFLQANHSQMQEKQMTLLDLQIEKERVLIEKEQIQVAKEKLLLQELEFRIENQMEK